MFFDKAHKIWKFELEPNEEKSQNLTLKRIYLFQTFFVNGNSIVI